MIAAELVIRGWLAARFPTWRVVTEMPKDVTLPGYLPLLHVSRFGGFNARPALDTVVMDVDAFALSGSGIEDPRDAVRSIAEQIRDALLFELPGYTVNGATVTGVITTAAPVFKPYDNTNLRRFGGTYTVYVKPSP